MLTRRRFLGYGATGMLTMASGCRPAHINLLHDQQTAANSNILSLAEKARFAKYKNRLLGYPVNMNTPPDAFFEWRQQLFDAGIGTFAYNNVGNPYKASAIPFNTHDFEREVIANFGRVYAFPPDDTWGFLSHSGTDSNMHGMYMGRTLLKGRTGLLPKVYFTKEAHYSVQILRDLMGLETIFVDTLSDSSMDPEDLKNKLKQNSKYPALVVATIGTTFKGAIDQVDKIQEALQGVPSYLHLDAALFGGFLPHTNHAGEVMHRSPINPEAPRYDSIAVSCHKFFGFASPAGLYITTQQNFSEFNELFSQIHNPEYIHHVPGTITCSRDAVKPAEFYFYSTSSALDKQAADTRSILHQTDYLMEQLQNHFARLQPQRTHPVSNTIYFKNPGERMIKKYSLATMHLTSGGKKLDYAHVVIMPHVDKIVLDEFLNDLEIELALSN